MKASVPPLYSVGIRIGYLTSYLCGRMYMNEVHFTSVKSVFPLLVFFVGSCGNNDLIITSNVWIGAPIPSHHH